jgi:translocation and assembly module TamB
VLQEAESIGLLGTLNTVQGTYYFYGRSFQITRGEVTFDRPEQINPQLDIAARTEVNGEHIDLLISGRLQSPSVTLTSSSGYGEGDIIALLTLQQTGTGLDTLAAKDVVSRQAQSIFGGYLQRAFNRKTGRFLGVETFRIQPDPKDRLNVRQAELTVGTYLSSQFYVEYSRRLSQESGEQVGIEYSLSENLSLQGRRDRDGLYRLGVTARWRY